MSSRLTSMLFVFVLACGGKQTPAPAAPPANEPVAETATPPPATPATPDDDRPASVTDDMVAIFEDMIVAMESMGKDLTAAGSDCSKSAAAIRNGMTAMKPIAERAKPYKDMKDPEAEEWFKQRYMPRLMTAVSPMMTAAQTCSSDQEFMDAMNEMGQLDM